MPFNPKFISSTERGALGIPLMIGVIFGCPSYGAESVGRYPTARHVTVVGQATPEAPSSWYEWRQVFH